MSCNVTLRLLLFAVLMAAPAAASVRLAVDCDAGDSLQAALDEAALKGGGRIRVSGTCMGSVMWTSDAYLEIIGDSPATSEIQAGVGTAVSATEPGYLLLRNLRLTGGQAVRAFGALRVIQVEDCEVAGANLGIRSDSGAAVVVADSTVSGGQIAVRVYHATVVVRRGRLQDSAFAARVFYGELFLEDVEVRDNEQGILAADRSDVTVTGGLFANTSGTHLSLVRDSRLTLYNTQIGGPDDDASTAVYADRGSAVEVSYTEAEIDIWGIAALHNDSYISINGATIHGSILLRDFSRLVLDGTVTDGSVQCDSAADAWCSTSASTFTLNCPSVPNPCAPP